MRSNQRPSAGAVTMTVMVTAMISRRHRHHHYRAAGRVAALYPPLVSSQLSILNTLCPLR
jgi:hypothetical protein